MSQSIHFSAVQGTTCTVIYIHMDSVSKPLILGLQQEYKAVPVRATDTLP